MYYTYILINKDRTRRYKGHCEDIEIRLAQHNTGSTQSTRGEQWEVEYYETFDTRTEAIVRERYFKTSAGRRWIGKHLGSIADRDSDINLT